MARAYLSDKEAEEMYTGPVVPVSTAAIKALDRIAGILKNVPIKEHKFVLSQAGESARAREK